MIIDSRPKHAMFDKGHVPNAVSIPDSSFDKMANLHPGNKNSLLIFYCFYSSTIMSYYPSIPPVVVLYKKSVLIWNWQLTIGC
jgi:hypothetical protein